MNLCGMPFKNYKIIKYTILCILKSKMPFKMHKII